MSNIALGETATLAGVDTAVPFNGVPAAVAHVRVPSVPGPLVRRRTA